VTLAAGATLTLAAIEGAGSITHIWMTVAVRDDPHPDFTPALRAALRSTILRIYWDGSEHPSVLTPVGDFFGVGHGRTVNFASLPLQMSPENGRGFNCFFHMPFAAGARIELQSEPSGEPLLVYFYVDYEEFDELESELGRFHAHWRRERTTAASQRDETNEEFLFTGTNLDGQRNYVILDTEGRGHYIGCVLSVCNLRDTDDFNWYGEGDDMIFVDGESFPPSLHGTGTEDYFNTAFCPTQPYSAPYHGITLAGGPNWLGEISLYRFHVEDPVAFERSIRVTIEHGHANKRSDELSSVAYWYQTLPAERVGER
jgi:hypothetical protein